MFRSHDDFNSAIRPKVEKEEVEEKLEYSCGMCANSDACDKNKNIDYGSETEMEMQKQAAHSKDVFYMKKADLLRGLCLVCARQFNSNSELLAHVKVCHLFTPATSQRVQREIFVCDTCQHVFFNKGLLVMHAIHKHNTYTQRPHNTKCPHCHKSIQRTSFFNHFEGSGMKSVATCPICLRKQRNSRALVEHSKSHPYHLQCDICNFVTFKQAVFDSHILKHNCAVNITNVGQQLLKRCYVGYKIPLEWNYRVQFVMNGLNLHSMVRICVLCREICLNSTDMRYHLVSAHLTSKTADVKVKTCSCGEMFPNLILLKHHVFKLKGDHVILGTE